MILASTVLLQVPTHAVLAQSYDTELVRCLVRTNWIRTIGWSARGGVAMAVLIDAMS